MAHPTVRFVGSPPRVESVYCPEERDRIAKVASFAGPPVSTDDLHADASALAEVEIVLGTWGMPRLDADLLDAAPKLKLVLYGAGSIRGFMTDAAWDRGIEVCSAWIGNAVPVAEMALSQILFSLKLGWQHVRTVKRQRQWKQIHPMPSGYHATVGLVSLGAIGRKVVEHLARHDVHVIAYDVKPDPELAERFGVRYVELDELFAAADVVSLHTPWLPETEGLITGELIRSMKRNATLINTSRGAVIDQQAMIAALQDREDLTAVLDVTYPEPPPPDSPMWVMDNFILTPHIAGALGPEHQRLGAMMVDDLERYVNGQPLQWQVSRELARTMA